MALGLTALVKGAFDCSLGHGLELMVADAFWRFCVRQPFAFPEDDDGVVFGVDNRDAFHDCGPRVVWRGSVGGDDPFDCNVRVVDVGECDQVDRLAEGPPIRFGRGGIEGRPSREQVLVLCSQCVGWGTVFGSDGAKGW